MIAWTGNRRGRIARALAKGPACVAIARDVFPIAKAESSDARGGRVVILDDDAARLVLPLNAAGRQRCGLDSDEVWYFHVNVGLLKHIVDRLTGEDGVEVVSYLSKYFDCSEVLRLDECDLSAEEFDAVPR